jgi:hypothetical protein
MGNSAAALGAIALNRVKHRIAKNFNENGVIFVQPLSADSRRCHWKMIRNQQVIGSSPIAGSKISQYLRA